MYITFANLCVYVCMQALQSVGLSILRSSDLGLGEYEQHAVTMFKQVHIPNVCMHTCM